MNDSHDKTESIRRSRLAEINGAVMSWDSSTERERLERRYGQVWDSAQLGQDFEIVGFMAPYIVVRRKSDGRKGSLEFQHDPRLYFNFLLNH